MNAQDFQRWLDVMKITKATQLVETIGWSRIHAQKIMAAVKSGESVTLKQVDELAMSALAQGLRKWSDYDR
ncbi:hypothetical protein [uncultured Cohaesibacter sp.]|uniref:hypothetical protein n=1 Tax=uncultured Cohaesibacter sp. TaxID=1002546 RepID=UPI0029C60796|nr:hypothetical protein [uncultured Cohaesibacter sp.]